MNVMNRIDVAPDARDELSKMALMADIKQGASMHVEPWHATAGSLPGWTRAPDGGSAAGGGSGSASGVRGGSASWNR